MQADAAKAEELTVRGIKLLTGEGAAHAPGEAALVLNEAAGLGSAKAAALMAVLAGSGIGRDQPSWSDAFDFLELAARLGERRAQQQLALLTEDRDAAARIERSTAVEDDVLRRAREGVEMRRWIAPEPAGLVAQSPQIAAFPRFIPHSICRWLIGRGEENPQVALVYDQETGTARPDPLRTNAASRLGVADSDLIVLLLQAKIATSTGLSTACMEDPSILRYDVGQQFAGHVDFFDPATPQAKAEIDALGQRVATFLVYLNDEYEGGQTEFPAANLRYRGKAGDAIIFYNVTPSGEPDLDSCHAGLPPTKGRKWLLSQWIRNKPQIIL